MGNDRDSGDNISTRLTYFLVGAGIGAVLALLFAPKSGEELRNDIADATRKGIDKSKEAARNWAPRRPNTTTRRDRKRASTTTPRAKPRESITKQRGNALLNSTTLRHRQSRRGS